MHLSPKPLIRCDDARVSQYLSKGAAVSSQGNIHSFGRPYWITQRLLVESSSSLLVKVYLVFSVWLSPAVALSYIRLMGMLQSAAYGRRK